MSVSFKYIIWVLIAALTALAVIVFASNFALVLTKSHDGEFHLFDVFWLLNSTSAKTVSMAKLGLMIGTGIAFFLTLSIWRNRSAQELHGSARFASEREIQKAGLRATTGIILGKFRGRYLVFGGNEHVMVYAPTRGGKGLL